MVLLKNVVENFGFPQFAHSHDRLLLFNKLSIPWQFIWYHCSQSSQHMALCFQVTALIQDPHGYFGGPRFGSGAT